MNFYIFRAKSHDLYKLGVTNNTFERLQAIQTGSPYRLKLEYSLQTNRAYEIEQTLITDFSKFRLQNEWFALPDYAIKMLYARIKEILSHEDVGLKLTQSLVDYSEVFSFSGLERLCGIPRQTLSKLQPPYRNIPYKHIAVLRTKLDEIFRSLI